MDQQEHRLKINEVTERIIASVYRVSNIVKPRAEIKRVVLDY